VEFEVLDGIGSGGGPGPSGSSKKHGCHLCYGSGLLPLKNRFGRGKGRESLIEFFSASGCSLSYLVQMVKTLVAAIVALELAVVACRCRL